MSTSTEYRPVYKKQTKNVKGCVGTQGLLHITYWELYKGNQVLLQAITHHL